MRGGEVSLRGGSHYRCRFGEVVVPATYVADAPAATLERQGPFDRREQGRPAYVGPHPNTRLLPPRTWRLDAHRPNSGVDAVLCVAPARAAVADGAGTLLVNPTPHPHPHPNPKPNPHPNPYPNPNPNPNPNLNLTQP